MSKLYEKNYLYLFTGLLDSDQVGEALNKTISNLPDKYNYNMIVNIVENKNYQRQGYAFVWIDNEKLYNILIGVNADGSKRTKYIDDPNWVPPEITKLEINETKEISESWGDLVDDDSDTEPPQIEISLESLYKFPFVKYTESQKEGNKNISEGCEIEIMPTMIIKDYGKKNSIYSNNISNEITIKDLLNVFKKI